MSKSEGRIEGGENFQSSDPLLILVEALRDRYGQTGTSHSHTQPYQQSLKTLRHSRGGGRGP